MYVLSAPSTGCGPAGSLPTPDLPFIRDLVLRVSAAEEDSDKPHPRWSDLTCLVLHQGWGAVWVLQAGGHQPLALDVAADLWQGLDLSCTSCVALPLVRLSASVAARPPSVWTLGSSGSLAKAYCPAQAARESLAPRNKRLARCMWSLASPWRSPNRCNSPAPQEVATPGRHQAAAASSLTTVVHAKRMETYLVLLSAYCPLQAASMVQCWQCWNLEPDLHAAKQTWRA